MGEPIRVLHVDDDPQFGELLKDFVAKIDPTIDLTAVTAADVALEHLEEHPVDCVLSDFDMPGRDGLELLASVREQGYDLPFILVTGKGSENVASEAISAGVTDYIQKSGELEQYELLANRVRNVVQSHRTRVRIQQVYEAIDVIDEGISLIDSSGEFVYVNEEYAEILGFEPEELTGRHWTVLYRSEQEVRTLEEDVFPNIPPAASDRMWKGETVKLRQDKTRVRTNHRLSYTSDGMMICLLSNPRDVDQNYDGPIAETA